MMVIGLLTTIASLVYVRHNEQRLEEEAEHAFPGPLDEESIYFLLTDHFHDDRNRAPRNYLNPDCIIYQEIASIARINQQIEALPSVACISGKFRGLVATWVFHKDTLARRHHTARRYH